MRALEKVIAIVSPKWAERRQKSLNNLKQAEIKTEASAYLQQAVRGARSYVGASNKSSMKDWYTNNNDANSSILSDLPLLRERSRDLYNNTAAARGSISTINTNVIGTGLLLRSTPDAELLGLSQEEAQAWSDKAEKEFRLWANSQLSCDYSQRLNFNDIQRLVSVSQQISGDVFVLMPSDKRPGTIYDLRLQLIEADRVCNPNDLPDTDKIAGGVEYNEKGIPIRVYIRTPHPGDHLSRDRPSWVSVDFYGQKSGRRNVLQVMEHERIDQARGVPILAPVIETIKQISRYAEAEIAAAVVNALLAVVITRPAESETAPGEISDSDDDGPKPWESSEQSLQTGTFMDLAPGEDLKVVEAARPSSQFEPFFLATMKQVGMGLGIPFEVLIKHFSSSYSASRAALLEAWKIFKVKRGFIVSNLCQPVYEEFLTEAVIRGRIYAPGFLTDLAVKAAYCQSQWVGPTPGQLDPGKEYDAANKAVEYGFSTRSRAAAELHGFDFDEVIKERARENALMERHGIKLNTETFQPVSIKKSDDTDKD